MSIGVSLGQLCCWLISAGFDQLRKRKMKGHVQESRERQYRIWDCSMALAWGYLQVCPKDYGRLRCCRSRFSRKLSMQVPVEGQALLDYARQDKVFRQLRRTPWPNSGDADMMAGAYELLLIYRKFIEQRGSSRKGKQEWTEDVRSEVCFQFSGDYLDHAVFSSEKYEKLNSDHTP